MKNDKPMDDAGLIIADLGAMQKEVRYYKQTIPVNIHHFYICSDIGDVGPYIDMINTIKVAEPHDTVFLYLNTRGGNLHTAIQIISAIKQSAATVITSLEGEVCSAGTMIFLSGNKHIVNDNCTFMIHNYSQITGGKGNELKTQVKYSEEYFKKLVSDIYSDFLTDEEIEGVLDDKDIWMGSDEVAERLGDKLIEKPTEGVEISTDDLLAGLPQIVEEMDTDNLEKLKLLIDESQKTKTKPKKKTKKKA